MLPCCWYSAMVLASFNGAATLEVALKRNITANLGAEWSHSTPSQSLRF